MVFFELFHHPEIRRYKAPLVTKATFFFVIFTALEVICPLIVAYRSYGFWMKEDTYTETPQVQFKYQAIFVLGTTSKNYVWSTYANLNNLQADNLLIPVVKIREVDADLNGRNELLNMQLSAPLADSERVHSVELLLFFEYRLFRMSYFVMESMAYINAQSFFEAGKLNVIGRLNFVQDELLGYKDTANQYQGSIVNSASIYPEDYDINNILDTYSKRNVTTRFENAYYRWERNRAAGQPFSLNATVIYTTPTIYFKPGFWYVLKWSWIQYLSMLLIFVFVFERVKTFVFQNQIVSTVVDRPFDPSNPYKN